MARYAVTTSNEATWVRSLYAYGVLMVSGLAAIVSLVLVAVSTLVLINPSSGLSGWERVLVGVPTVLDEGLDIAETYFDDQWTLPEYCTDDLTEDDPDYELCQEMQQQAEQPLVPDEADQAIALIKDETLRQVRHSAIARLVGAAMVFVVAALVFSRHKRLVALYDRGAPDTTTTVVTTDAPLRPDPSSPVPPPPPPG